MDIFRRIADSFRRVKAWYTSRKNRRARRVAGAVADTAAAGTGLVLRTAVKAVMTVLLVFITTGMILACIFAIYVKTCLTEELNLTPEELSSALSSHIWAETSPGSEQWQEVATLYATENRIWVDYDQIPINMVHAAVAIEDQRFYRHKGVDWWRTIGAFGSMFLSMDDTFGGSTLTQQLIKNLTGKNEVTVQRKLLEMFRALEFEKKYTKEEIVTWYLNEIYLSEGCYGVGAAAREYFNKEVWELDLAECASLIGITNNPSLYDPYIGPKSTERNKTRQELILKEMYKQEYITYDEYVAAKSEQLHFKRAEGEQREIPVNSYYVDSLVWELVEDLAEDRGITTRQAESLVYNGGYNIYSCMDLSIQQIVDDVFQNPENLPEAYYSVSGQKLSAAIVIMDPYDGSIVALEGDTGVKTGSFTDNYATELVRRPGSSFKPVAVYAPALDLGLITQNTSVNDSPNIQLRGTTWYPKNDGGGYSGVINIRTGPDPGPAGPAGVRELPDGALRLYLPGAGPPGRGHRPDGHRYGLCRLGTGTAVLRRHGQRDGSGVHRLRQRRYHEPGPHLHHGHRRRRQAGAGQSRRPACGHQGQHRLEHIRYAPGRRQQRHGHRGLLRLHRRGRQDRYHQQQPGPLLHRLHQILCRCLLDRLQVSGADVLLLQPGGRDLEIRHAAHP